MRSTKLILAMSAICTGLYSQPFTGIDTYIHTPRLTASDGNNTSFNSKGNIIAGYQAAATTANPLNFYIDKTDVAGNVPGGIFFHNEYKFVADNIKPCGGNLVAATNCYGVAINELKYAAGGQWYNLTAGFDRGYLYSDLDQNGIPMASNYYTFPGQATNVSKPAIASSNLMTGRTYLAGSYALNGIYHMNLMLVGLGGGLGWTRDYTNTTGGELIPSAIIESPYSSTPQLIVVGTYNIGGSTLRDGFFAVIDGTTGNIINFWIYTYQGASNERCLSVAAAANGPAGFVIGGSTDANPANGTAWMAEVDQIGGSFVWSSVIKPSTTTNGAVVGVRERFSNVYGRYEYYGAVTANNALTVVKLNDIGGMFNSGPNNEFLYNDNVGGRCVPAAIGYLDSGTGTLPNDGIQVFGMDASPALNLVITRACFNGAAGNAGCTTPTNIRLNTLPASNVTPGPNLIAAVPINISAGIVPCTQFNFAGGNTAVTKVAPCDETNLPVMPYPGNQNKSSGITGITTVSADADRFSISPNPVADKMVVNYSSNTESGVTISLYNNLGQLVTPALTPDATKGNNQVELDLSAMNINSGVYFVTVVADGVKTTKKIVYTK